MRVKLWGTRGSLPSPKSPHHLEKQIRTLLYRFFEDGYKQVSDIDQFLNNLPIHEFGGFGGDTLCVEVSTPKQQLIVDGGSGIRSLGYEMLNGACGCGRGEVHILLTHFHWDHLIGLLFFTPLFIPGNKVHVYAVQPELPKIFATIFQRPYFPLNLNQIDAAIEYHILEPRQPVNFNDITVTPYQLDHPDPCWGYKFESNGKVFSHCVDNEIKRVSREDLGDDLPLYQGVDLMVIDAQYTLLESTEKVNWGHGSALLGLEIAMREGIKRVWFIHNDPAASDEKIAAAIAETKCVYNNQLKMMSHRSDSLLHKVEWEFARDGFSTEYAMCN